MENTLTKMTQNEAFNILRGAGFFEPFEEYRAGLRTGVSLKWAEEQICLTLENTDRAKEALELAIYYKDELEMLGFESTTLADGTGQWINKRSASSDKAKVIESWDFVKREVNFVTVLDEKHATKIKKYWIRKLEAVQHKQEQLNKEAVRIQELIEKI